jgi:hypothetical protein
LEFAFNAAEIPGSFIRSGINAYNNFNTPAWKSGGEPFRGTNILGQFNNGEEDQSFMNAQRIARPGAGLLEQSAIRLGTDPGVVGNLPALIKAAPGAFRSAYGAVKAARDAAGRRVVPFSQQGYGSITRQQYMPKTPQDIELAARLRAVDIEMEAKQRYFDLANPPYAHLWRNPNATTRPGFQPVSRDDFTPDLGEFWSHLPAVRPRTEHPYFRPVIPKFAGGKMPSNFDTILPFDIAPPKNLSEYIKRTAESNKRKPPLDPGNRLNQFWPKPPI